MSIGCCAIVEPRKHPALELTLRYTRATLPDWPIFIWHGTDNEDYVRNITKDMSDVHFISLKRENLTLSHYNKLLTNPKFYQTLIDYTYVLIFQTDSLIFPFSPYTIEDFLGFDYVGAPWRYFDDTNLGGNGGLSLRHIPNMIRLLSKHPYTGKQAEDVYICSLPGIHLPPRSVSERFSIESIEHPCPFGTHKPWWNFNPKQLADLISYAPAVETLWRLNQ